MPTAQKESAKWLRTHAVVFLAAALLSACDKSEQKQVAAPAPPAVTVVKVARTEITPTSSFTGRIEAVDRVIRRAGEKGFNERGLFGRAPVEREGALLFPWKRAQKGVEIEGKNE